MPRAGDTIADRYILERPVAEGGMGSVWRARHSTLGRYFAIKFLKTALLGGEPLEQRFLREARLAASVRHRFVVDIVDFGVTAHAAPYMVMEFLEGESLDRRCRRRPPLPVRALLRICAETLLGLEAVHQTGVIHRDLKPENIMLVRQSDGIFPKLVDFGISRPESIAATALPGELPTRFCGDGKRLTHPEAFLGTPWYMSPEQARRAESDRRSDLYSMGVILYEALAGEAPYDHPDLPLLIEAVKAGGAPPLLARRPELGAALSELVARAMALDPAARFESAAEMSARLLEVAAQLPEALACPEPPVVSRTDTEVIEPVPAGGPVRTQELAGDPEPPHTRRVSRTRDPRFERVMAVAGALAGAAFLLWAATRPDAREGIAPGTPLQASMQTPVPLAVSGVAPAPVEAMVPSSPPPVTATEERRPAGRRSARAPARPSVPDVFRTPGF